MRTRAHGISTVGALFLACAPAWAQESAPVEDRDDPIAREVEAIKAYGEQGSRYWSVVGEGALSGDGNVGGGRVSVGYFLADQFEIHASLGLWRHVQEDGNDATSLNPSVGFRYHLFLEEDWSVYADVGVGLLFSTDEVPIGGTRTNFTPRLGVGATFAIGDDGARLDIGARWHHVSNASTSGIDDNPDRDGIGLYVGLIFPF